jgi:hypothetical protein
MVAQFHKIHGEYVQQLIPIIFLSSCLALAIIIVWQIRGLETRKMK